MNRVSVLLSFLIALTVCNFSYAENYIIKVNTDNNTVMLDVTKTAASVGARYQALQPGEVVIHPVTGQRIETEPTVIATLEIIQVTETYSIAKVVPAAAIDKLKVGMVIAPATAQTSSTTSSGTGAVTGQTFNIAMHSFAVAGQERGFTGKYMGDILIMNLMDYNEFRTVDRATLDSIMQEHALTLAGVTSQDSAVKVGEIAGVQYFLLGFVDQMDVHEISTSIPLSQLAQAAQSLSGQNIGAQYVSDVQTKRLVAIISVQVKVIKVETGEIVFSCSEQVKAEGQSQVNLEAGAFNGLELNGGVTAFNSTILGQATRQAMQYVAADIDGYFSGRIAQRTYRGHTVSRVTGGGSRNQDMMNEMKEWHANNIAVRNTPLSISEARQSIDGGLDIVFPHRTNDIVFRGSTIGLYMPSFTNTSISGQQVRAGEKLIGTIKITSVEQNLMMGHLRLSGAENSSMSIDEFKERILQSAIAKILPQREFHPRLLFDGLAFIGIYDPISAKYISYDTAVTLGIETYLQPKAFISLRSLYLNLDVSALTALSYTRETRYNPDSTIPSFYITPGAGFIYQNIYGEGNNFRYSPLYSKFYFSLRIPLPLDIPLLLFNFEGDANGFLFKIDIGFGLKRLFLENRQPAFLAGLSIGFRI